ncbi:MAG: RsmD family RNA methyltransferase [Bifidobacteriaceae bacterium]|jgi:16S rRNA (guanine966-N2)-methyltransferase|nr:RsmD family RNA methyltransferase [Bifidobacteriaceae bacterium]
MTRIIAGTVGGRTLKVPVRDTRPTSDRVREALFSWLETLLGRWRGPDAWRGLVVLDLYAGSGALALEALSRGAASALAVESSPAAVRVIRANAAALGLAGRLAVRSSRVETVLGRPPPALAAGPGGGSRTRPPDGAGGRGEPGGAAADGRLGPGRAGSGGRGELGRADGIGQFGLVFLDPPYDLPAAPLDGALARLAAPGWLADGALAVVERSARAAAPAWPDGWENIGKRKYGETQLHLARAGAPGRIAAPGRPAGGADAA